MKAKNREKDKQAELMNKLFNLNNRFQAEIRRVSAITDGLSTEVAKEAENVLNSPKQGENEKGGQSGESI